MTNEVFTIDDNERIVFMVRKHWIILLRDTLGTLLVAFLPFLIFPLFYITGILDALPLIPLALLDFLTATWFLLIWITLTILWTNYYLDIWIMTNKRIANINQINLFHREVAVWSLERIQEIRVRNENVLQVLLGYGTLEIETAGPTPGNTLMEGVPRPEEVRTKILAALEQTSSKEGL